MENEEIDEWLDSAIKRHETLTGTVVNITESLLNANGIDYLAVTGRTKSKVSAKEKIKRKSYTQPDKELTDLSGVRVIVYFESDVREVSSIIESSFFVDETNSLSKDSLLATDQIGYRSIHYVCELGSKRTELPEFTTMKSLKFEFQVRTVLQHAWAELAHDRNYKFSGKLPKEIERRLYLYAGMLEIADNGFDELSNSIDQYISDFKARAQEGDYDVEINSLSLEEFVDEWAQKHAFPLDASRNKNAAPELVSELKQFGLQTIDDLREIIPADYADIARKRNYNSNIYGLVRDWMLIHDYRKYYENVSYNWSSLGSDEKVQIFSDFLSKEQVGELYALFEEE